MNTNNLGLKVHDPYKAELFGQISQPQSPRQETFWASAGFESTEKSVTLYRIILIIKINKFELNS